MAITSHYWLCVREILHLSRSQLIIDFAFIHSEFVNDFVRVIRFFRLFLLPPVPSFIRPLKTSYQLRNRKITSTRFPKAGSCVFVNTISAEMSLLKANA